jgi:hypothetical protein
MRAALTMLLAMAVSACQLVSSQPGRTVSLRVKGNVPNASVTIDDIRVGPLGYVAARGVALPPGKHRVTVEHEGYFPWDKLVEATDAPVLLDVQLIPIPD